MRVNSCLDWVNIRMHASSIWLFASSRMTLTSRELRKPSCVASCDSGRCACVRSQKQAHLCVYLSVCARMVCACAVAQKHRAGQAGGLTYRVEQFVTVDRQLLPLCGRRVLLACTQLLERLKVECFPYVCPEPVLAK
eukprot:COSAG06_NODE_1228_length_10179_cov_3.735119_9_plen_137_part_00